MSSDTNASNFVIFDMETSGLNHQVDVILEVGVKVFSSSWTLIGTTQHLVVSPGWRPLLSRNSYVWDMHMKSGLTEDLAYLENSGQAEAYTPKKIEYAVLQFLSDTMGLKSGENPITGSSVEFDRRFLREYMPLLEAWFHHRTIDVSTVKELCKRRNPDLYAAMKRQSWADESNKKHRVLDDIDFTVEELKFYEDNFLFVENFDDPTDPFLIPDQQALPGM